MIALFRKIGLAIAFSPTAQGMVAEAARLAQISSAELVLIHVGSQSAENEERMQNLLQGCRIPMRNVSIRWVSGDPAVALLAVCDAEHLDLLVTGALKKENLVNYYVGSIARKVLRTANCSVMTIVNPSVNPQSIRNIVVNAEDSAYIHEAISTACGLGNQGSWVHVVRELKLYGLTMASSDQYTEDEYEDVRQRLVRQEIDQVEGWLRRIPHEGLKINIKVVSGKSGFELPRFAERKRADLLVIGAAEHKSSFFDRVFQHDMEYILADLPCNLLVVQTGKEAGHG